MCSSVYYTLFCLALFVIIGKFKGASGAAGKGKGVKRKRAQVFKPPLAVIQGNEEALLDAGLEGNCMTDDK